MAKTNYSRRNGKCRKSSLHRLIRTVACRKRNALINKVSYEESPQIQALTVSHNRFTPFTNVKQKNCTRFLHLGRWATECSAFLTCFGASVIFSRSIFAKKFCSVFATLFIWLRFYNCYCSQNVSDAYRKSICWCSCERGVVINKSPSVLVSRHLITWTTWSCY